MNIVKAQVIILTSIVVSSFCGCGLSSDGDEEPRALTVSASTADVTDLDPGSTSILDESKVGEALAMFEAPKANVYTDSETALAPARTLNLGGSDCESEPAQLDRITASGPTLVVEIIKDDSSCVRKSMEDRGFNVTTSEVRMEGVYKLFCPDTDFSALNGMSYISLKTKEERARLRCEYVGPQTILVERHVRGNLNLDVRYGSVASHVQSTIKSSLFGPNKACEIKSEGSYVTFSRCTSAERIKKKHVSTSEGSAASDGDYLFRVDLSQQKAVRFSKVFMETETPAVSSLNNWTGTLKFSNTGSAKYSFTDSVATKAGVLY